MVIALQVWHRCGLTAFGVLVLDCKNVNASLTDKSDNIDVKCLWASTLFLLFIKCASKSVTQCKHQADSYGQNFDSCLHFSKKLYPACQKAVTSTCFSIVHVCMHHVSMASQFIWNFRRENCWRQPFFSQFDSLPTCHSLSKRFLVYLSHYFSKTCLACHVACPEMLSCWLWVMQKQEMWVTSQPGVLSPLDTKKYR